MRHSETGPPSRHKRLALLCWLLHLLGLCLLRSAAHHRPCLVIGHDISLHLGPQGREELDLGSGICEVIVLRSSDEGDVYGPTFTTPHAMAAPEAPQYHRLKDD